MAVPPEQLSPEAAARMAVQEDECRAVLRARLNVPTVTRVLAVVHSQGPPHYTLLERTSGPDGQYQLRYFDSLRQFSENGRIKAQVFSDQCGWGPVPVPCNKRFQDDQWSCGLWALQFVEESVRRHREEPVVVPVVSVSALLARVNKSIDSLAAHRPSPDDPVPQAPVPKNSDFTTVFAKLDKTSAEAKGAAVPLASVVDVSPPVPPPNPPPVAPPPKSKPATISVAGFTT